VSSSQFSGKYSTFLAIKEMQIKMTLRFHLTPVTMAIIKKRNKTKYWQGGRNTYAWLGGM
jgi:hypothetical protein